jgi:hypothetical protein
MIKERKTFAMAFPPMFTIFIALPSVKLIACPFFVSRIAFQNYITRITIGYSMTA